MLPLIEPFPQEGAQIIVRFNPAYLAVLIGGIEIFQSHYLWAGDYEERLDMALKLDELIRLIATPYNPPMEGDMILLDEDIAPAGASSLNVAADASGYAFARIEISANAAGASNRTIQISLSGVASLVDERIALSNGQSVTRTTSPSITFSNAVRASALDATAPFAFNGGIVLGASNRAHIDYQCRYFSAYALGSALGDAVIAPSNIAITAALTAGEYVAGSYMRLWGYGTLP